MNVLDLFSGIGGFSLGLERAGMRTVAFCEIDEWCRELLRKRWPSIEILGDIRTAEFPSADVICGGFPCQDISHAGKRAGVAGERSGLYREILRAIRLVRPRFAILENVAALLGNGMGRLLGDVAENGLDAEWDCISAGDLGAPHGRDRVWITLADPDKLERAQRVAPRSGWWLWGSKEAEPTRNANGQWQLEPARLLGEIRRRVDDAARERAWWTDHWKAKFEALRGMDDGRPSRLDRNAVSAAVKRLGNTVVPQIPEIIGRAIMNLEATA